MYWNALLSMSPVSFQMKCNKAIKMDLLAFSFHTLTHTLVFSPTPLSGMGGKSLECILNLGSLPSLVPYYWSKSEKAIF